MAIQLTDANIAELSVVFGNFGGKEYAPRNEEARVLSVKGGKKIAKASARAAKSGKKISKAIEALKAYFSTSNDLQVMPYPVTEADDNIDNDGDGPEDYNQILFALCAVYNDVSQAWCISDDGARSAAIVKSINAFLLGLDALREGDSEKAGARHSAVDQAHIEALQAAHAKAKKAVDSMGDHLSALQPAAKAGEVDPDASGVVPTLSDTSSTAAEISQPTENDMTQDEINALVADAAAKAAEAAVAKANEAAQVKIDAAQAEAETAKAAAEKARLDAEADAQAKLAEANTALEAAKAAEKAAADESAALKAAAVKTARTPSGGSTQTTQETSVRLQAAVKAALVGAGSTIL